MNRHERRKQAAQQRQDRSASFHITDQRGKSAFADYMCSDESTAIFGECVAALERWRAANPDTAKLVWHPQREQQTIVTGPLGAPEAQAFLAASPEAIALLRWLDAETGGRAMTLHAAIALEAVGMVPGKTIYSSPGMAVVQSYLKRDQVTRVKPSPCPGCGMQYDGAGSQKGLRNQPGPGDWSVCVNCGTICCYNEDMVLRLPTPQEWQECDPEMRAALEDAGATFRTATMAASYKGRAPAGDA